MAIRAKKSVNLLHLPPEIVYMILLILPIKSLTRFKSVCKSWLSLISSPRFHIDHYNLSQNTPLLLTLKIDNTNTTSNLHFSTHIDGDEETIITNFSKTVPHRYHYQDIIPIQSCRGLVCIGVTHDNAGVLVCNPTTQEITSLPPFRGDTYTACIGFGCAASTQELKVVRFFSRLNISSCEVYTFGGGDWREARNPPPFPVNTGAAPFLHGALHLLPNPLHGHVDGEDWIAVFNIESEEYNGIELPECYHSILRGDCAGLTDLGLTELGGRLCLTFDFVSCEERMDIWLLQDYAGGGWLKWYNIDFSSVIDESLRSVSVHPLGVMVDENTHDARILIIGVGSELWYYHLEDKNVFQRMENACPAILYEESFFSPMM